MQLDALYALIAKDMQAVDAVIRERLHSDVVLVRQVAEYIVQSGGKRMRPALVLLVGDFLYSRAFQMMVNVGDMRVMEVLSDATNIIAEGEVLQLMNGHDADVEIDGYLRVIRYKTAKLFEAASRLGALLGGANAEVEAAMAAYGMHLGTAFQLVDDVLDYSGEQDEIGKSLGDDLAEGKPTLPLIHVIQNGTAEQAACVRRAIETGGRDEFDAVLAAVRETGALEETRRYAEAESAAAQKALECLPASQYKESLIELSSFAVARRH